MEFKIVYIFPVILVALSLVSVFFLTEIDPFNLVIAAVVFVIAIAMVWRIYYDISSVPKKQETEYEPSSKLGDLMNDGPKESKMKLDDFLKSSPKDFGEDFDLEKEPKTTADPFTKDSLKDESYTEMKQKALKELKDVIKPTKQSKIKKPINK